MDKNNDNITEKKTSSRKTLAVLIAIIVVFALLFVVMQVANKKEQPETETPVTEVQTEGAEETEEAAPAEASEPVIDTMMEIETPYGVLNYSAAYEDVLVCEETKDGDAVSEAFYSTITEDKVELFTLHFQKPDEGQLIGYIQDGEEKISVTIQMAEKTLDESSTDNQKEKFSAMIDGVNDIIASITTLESFTQE